MKHKHLDEPGARNIRMSPMHPDHRDLERLEITRARGIHPVCRRCKKTCKVLRGTTGMRGKLICYEAIEKSAMRARERKA